MRNRCFAMRDPVVDREQRSLILLWIAIFFYVLALFLPYEDGQIAGYQLFVLGLFFACCRFWHPLAWPWLANPLFLIALMSWKRSPHKARLLAGLAFLLGLTWFVITNCWKKDDSHMPGPAYWFWIGSMLFLLISANLRATSPAFANQLFATNESYPRDHARVPESDPSRDENSCS